MLDVHSFFMKTNDFGRLNQMMLNIFKLGSIDHFRVLLVEFLLVALRRWYRAPLPLDLDLLQSFAVAVERCNEVVTL